jgi:hypothetical protein
MRCRAPQSSVQSLTCQLLLCIVSAFYLLQVLSVPSFASGSKLDVHEREQIIRNFLQEKPFVHRALPRGRAGVRIEGSRVTPSDAELRQLVLSTGAVAKPGERVKITAVKFVHGGILFEINGGPAKRKPLRDRIQIGVGGIDPTASQVPTDAEVSDASGGSSVFLELKDEATVTAEQVKDLLAPVLDFKAQTAAEAYQKTLPPKLAAAIKTHRALVGMDHDMVLYAMGRPQKRIREMQDGREVEEWIYGEPPRDVQFIRFLGERVVRIEEMTVSGQKIVRTQDEVGPAGGVLNASQRPPLPGAAAAPSDDDRRGAPTLLRPGEKQEKPDATAPDRPLPPPDVSGPSSTDGGSMSVPQGPSRTQGPSLPN